MHNGYVDDHHDHDVDIDNDDGGDENEHQNMMLMLKMITTLAVHRHFGFETKHSDLLQGRSIHTPQVGCPTHMTRFTLFAKKYPTVGQPI